MCFTFIPYFSPVPRSTSTFSASSPTINLVANAIKSKPRVLDTKGKDLKKTKKQKITKVKTFFQVLTVSDYCKQSLKTAFHPPIHPSIHPLFIYHLFIIICHLSSITQHLSSIIYNLSFIYHYSTFWQSVNVQNSNHFGFQHCFSPKLTQKTRTYLIKYHISLDC